MTKLSKIRREILQLGAEKRDKKFEVFRYFCNFSSSKSFWKGHEKEEKEKEKLKKIS